MNRQPTPMASGYLWILLSFVLIAAGFLVFDIFNYTYHWLDSRILNITLEKNIPTGFSVLLLVAIGMLAMMLYAQTKQWGWVLLGVFFIYMGIDDAFVVHEQIATALFEELSVCRHDGGWCQWLLSFSSYYWQVFFAPVFIGMGMFIVVFCYKALPSVLAWRLLLAGLSAYALAVGLDYIEGANHQNRLLPYYPYLNARELEHVIRAIEEFIEMLGSSFILVAFIYTHAFGFKNCSDNAASGEPGVGAY